ncbi:MAG TPA: hypothetical protein VNR00_09125 [Opitutus sp.]|nr:hypothetical protein [Opitutus sp.]
MKTKTMLTNIVAAGALALGTALVIPSAWAQTSASSVTQVCTDARTVSVKEAKWVPGLGRGVVIVDAGKALVCNSCTHAAPAARPRDRNSNGAKSTRPTKNLHDCNQGGCAGGKAALAK